MKRKLRVGILGATGMVGQRLITLLSGHPWFEVASLAASPRSAGKRYGDAVKHTWKMAIELSSGIRDLTIKAVEADLVQITKEVDFVFCALDLDKEKIKEIEIAYAAAGIPVVSNNSAHRWTEDVPMIIPEVNPTHIQLIDIQRKKRGWKRGFIAVKPNCSIQTYVPVLTALRHFEPKEVEVVSLQAISGAGKTFESWPEMVDNVIPYIGGEEEKSEKEPLKIWGQYKDGHISNASIPVISATCVRVSVADGHMACISVNFGKVPTREDILSAIQNYPNPIEALGLPSAPREFMTYLSENNRPQTNLDRNFENGMGITMGRLRKGILFDWQLISLSHNTLRGAAGGAVLMAELLVKKGYIEPVSYITL